MTWSNKKKEKSMLFDFSFSLGKGDNNGWNCVIYKISAFLETDSE
ncbi:hypothetical protein ACVWXS_001786 [Lysinibacillus sp. TE18511]